MIFENEFNKKHILIKKLSFMKKNIPYLFCKYLVNPSIKYTKGSTNNQSDLSNLNQLMDQSIAYSLQPKSSIRLIGGISIFLLAASASSSLLVAQDNNQSKHSVNLSLVPHMEMHTGVVEQIVEEIEAAVGVEGLREVVGFHLPVLQEAIHAERNVAASDRTSSDAINDSINNSFAAFHKAYSSNKAEDWGKYVNAATVVANHYDKALQEGLHIDAESIKIKRNEWRANALRGKAQKATVIAEAAFNQSVSTEIDWAERLNLAREAEAAWKDLREADEALLDKLPLGIDCCQASAHRKYWGKKVLEAESR